MVDNPMSGGSVRVLGKEERRYMSPLESKVEELCIRVDLHSEDNKSLRATLEEVRRDTKALRSLIEESRDQRKSGGNERFSRSQHRQQGSPGGSPRKWSPMRCFNCQQDGHGRRDCPHPRRDRTPSPKGRGKSPNGCWTCGADDHKARECPNRVTPKKRSVTFTAPEDVLPPPPPFLLGSPKGRGSDKTARIWPHTRTGL